MNTDGKVILRYEFTFVGLLRNVIFCHPDPECSEGEGSIHRRDSSPSALPQCQNDVIVDSNDFL